MNGKRREIKAPREGGAGGAEGGQTSRARLKITRAFLFGFLGLLLCLPPPLLCLILV